MSNYPEGSMRGSGIFSDEFDYEDFVCENDECLFENKQVVAQVDDWGDYTVVCQKCKDEYTNGNVNEDRESAAAEAAYEQWKDDQL
jgi:hypothetical protein